MSDAFVFDPPSRILMGPGPSMVPPRVLAALARPTVGYLDASYVQLMDQVRVKLRRLFGTTTGTTWAVTGSGTAAMEAAVYNVVEPGDTVVACVHGYFGDRMRQIAARAGARVEVVEQSFGRPVDLSAVREKLASVGRVKAVTVVHGETSTGVQQELSELAELAHAHEGLLIADAVASLGGVPFAFDEWDLDIAYTGSQKCLSVPPGVSPIVFGPRAMQVIGNRAQPCASWYLDATLNLQYWNAPHRYHHTGPINLMYALYEGLTLLEEQGLEERIAHTRRCAEALWSGLEALGLRLLVPPQHRLPTLTTVQTPAGLDEAAVRRDLMREYDIEIAGGLGPWAGTAWRIGLMGASASAANVMLLLTALEQLLARYGVSVSAGKATAAAQARLHTPDVRT